MSRRMNNYRLMAEQFYTEGNLQGALSMYEKSLQFSKGKKDISLILFNIGVIKTQQEDYDSAKEVYEKLIELDPDYRDAYYQIGVIEESHYDFDNAVRNYEKALEIDPDHTMSMYNLASIYDSQGHEQSAITLYNKILVLEPQHPYVLNNLGAIFESREEYQKAYEYIKRSMEIKDDFFLSHFNMGVVLKALGQNQSAMDHYRRSMELEPYHQYTYLNMSAIHIEEEDYSEAIRILTKGIENNPIAHDLYYNRACSLAITGHPKKALEDMEQSISLHPPLLEWVLRDKDFDSLREYQRYKEIIQQYSNINRKEEINDYSKDQ